jgi:hypothetical protein
MAKETMTGIEFEDLYKSRLLGRFPYSDCYWIAQKAPIESEDLIPELDWYFGTIAGYCSSASRLGNRSKEDLQKAKKSLALKFFEVFPRLAPIERLITQDQTPKLYEEMKYTEQARLALLELLDVLEVD